MSILADRGLVRPLRPVRQVAPARRDVAPGPSAPARVARERRGEPLRPPTRARVVAGRKGTAAACAEARRPAVRWPWLLAIAAAACLVVTALGVFGAGAPGGAVPSRTASVSVEQGDTLSAIAARFAPDSDQDAVVTRIKQLNNLDGAVLTPGLPLTVPVAGGGAGLGS
ncbi:LysM peptidoglycan-binding domain-containing protein [Amycolatopsis sp. NBC_00345]|jgi:hypothetical protein|uniref:LysM peptidoglycan-binding domain-containing protein n=1 Tax=Amycolatopsis sp. NBC_00345 TaxID=2975955 RepID=UPI002E27177C